MVDEEDLFPHEQQQEPQKIKTRRLRGACDNCRKRKIKCDSAIRSGSICSNCELSYLPCTHDAPRQPTKKETQEGYIQSMEERLEKMQCLFQVLHPDKDIEILLDLPIGVVSESDNWTTRVSSNTFPMLAAPHLTLSHVSTPDSVNQDTEADRQSSSYTFSHYAMRAKVEASGSYSFPLDTKLRRPLYWEMCPWELSFARSNETPFVYPEPDLLNSLVTLYFDKSNIFVPILHKPIFRRSLTLGLHLRDPGFGMTVLLVCAIASRFTSDSRVVLDDDITSLSSGWIYYSQVPNFRHRLFERCTLYDIQCYVLSTIYLLGTCIINASWPMIGLGLRFAQEKGLHRRKGPQTVENELEKRAFWCLIVVDCWMSAFFGRPCGMQDEELDLDYPAECDDEYWETPDPNDAFRQPPGKPCQITYFIWSIKLVKILGFAHRTLYGTKKSKILNGLIGRERESEAVAELDSSMNKLRDSIPHYLRWNSENPDNTFFWQSIALYTTFYHLQIQIHRPFLMKRSTMSFTSLAICNNAARSTSHVLEVASSRGAALFPSLYMSAFTAALVLLLTHWVYQPTDSTFDAKTTMQFVRKLLYTLKDGERKWHLAGRLCDLTHILGCLSDQRSNPPLKRRRESDAVDLPIPQSQEIHHGALREQASFSGGNLKRQISSSNLEPLALTQASSAASSAPTNTWDDFHGQPSHAQRPFMTGQVASNLDQPLGQSAGPPTSFFAKATDFQLPLSSQIDPGLQAHTFIADQMARELDRSGDLFKMWANVPMNFSPDEWQEFLENAMQPQPQQ